MPDQRISMLPVADPLAGDEIFPIVQDGVTRQVTVADMALEGLIGPPGPAGATGATGYLLSAASTDLASTPISAADGTWPASGTLEIRFTARRSSLDAASLRFIVRYGSDVFFSWAVRTGPGRQLFFSVTDAAGTGYSAATALFPFPATGSEWLPVTVRHVRSTGVTTFVIDGVTTVAATTAIPANHTLRTDGDRLKIGVIGAVSSATITDGGSTVLAAPDWTTKQLRPDSAGRTWILEGNAKEYPVVDVPAPQSAPVLWERFNRADGTFADEDRMTSGAKWRVSTTTGAMSISGQKAIYPMAGAAYLWTTLGAPPRRVEVAASFAAGSTNNAGVLLMASPVTDWNVAPASSSGPYLNSLHIFLSPVFAGISIYEAGTSPTIKSFLVTAPAAGVVAVTAVELVSADTITLTTWDGKRYAFTDSRIATYWGSCVGTEFSIPGGSFATDRQPSIHRFDAY